MRSGRRKPASKQQAPSSITLIGRANRGRASSVWTGISEDFAAEVPHARVEIIENASHTGHLEQREVFMAKLRAFLASLE
jgi:pimeloyl-ACP methyl ester carboxylesterase